MYSMTGYGKAEYVNEGMNITVEIRTVNNRNLDINTKIPRAFIGLEDVVRGVIKDKLSRGRVDVFVNYKDDSEKNVNVSVNLELAKAYYKASEEISKSLGIINDYSVSRLMTAPDVLSSDGVTDYAEYKDVLISLTSSAIDSLNVMRKTEGEKLVADMKSRMVTIKGFVDKIKERAPLVAKEYKEKLKDRIETYLQGVEFDEARLLNEVAFFTDKSNIDEELTRLYSHIAQFYEIVNIDGAGKKLDFLIQEFNRETNTICSKSNDIEITNIGLNLKNEIEKIREQVQNLE